ncbi:CBS domain-containing protein [Cytobacillus sp. S13-E01]|uniref:CBS domain-containing protein n=1 Tax=Cytobacillus sp. S13-E01 TaxID=3031326 RepID=UPI0023D81039|nr:CBS domain-containing protein [Cytobacillus sp. S13-E01]MDF0728776.1 CBS domain-containing protein [Cytobacillus sp. S13-E01]
MSIRELMTDNVATVSPNQTIKEAATLMSQYNVGAIPVVENGQLKGIITDRDITLRSTAEGRDNSIPVSHVMSSEIVQGSPDMGVEEAAALMSQKQIRRLPIVENNNLVGIVALGDIATNHTFDNEAEQALSSISVPSQRQL